MALEVIMKDTGYEIVVDVGVGANGFGFGIGAARSRSKRIISIIAHMFKNVNWDRCLLSGEGALTIPAGRATLSRLR